MTKQRERRLRRVRVALYFALLCVSLVVIRWHHGQEEVEARSETEALARVIRSEIGVGSQRQKLHVAWVARNLAAERGESVLEMACSPCGEQRRGRPLSTRQEATASDRRLAERVLESDPSDDPTGGATHFMNPLLQDRLAKSGSIPGYKGRTYQKVRRHWRRSYGWEPYYRIGPDLEIWGPRRHRPKSKLRLKSI